MTRDEVVRGERMVAMPSLPEHGDRHFSLDYVLGAHLKRDYVGSTDLITRFGGKSDFATDTCIRKTGKNPRTGERYLEEVAFEVIHTQSDKEVRMRAEDISARGVRRFFAIFVKKGVVAEWLAKQKSFAPLDLDGEISDRTLATPVRVRALLDAVEADNGVARALLAKNNPVLEAENKRQHEQGLEEGRAKGVEEGRAKGVEEGRAKGVEEGRAKGVEEGVLKGREVGLLEGKASAVIAVLVARGQSISPDLRRTILACTDERTLDAWLRKAATASSADELLGAPSPTGLPSGSPRAKRPKTRARKPSSP